MTKGNFLVHYILYILHNFSSVSSMYYEVNNVIVTSKSNCNVIKEQSQIKLRFKL